jgi:phosphoglycolate phosphatase
MYPGSSPRPRLLETRVGLDRELNHHELTPFFKHTRCSAETRPKPQPAMLHELLEAFQVGKTRALMVGDTTMYLDMANAAGMDAVAVTTGGPGSS